MDAFHELLHRIFQFDFMASTAVIEAYIRMLTHFVTAHANFVKPTVQMLVRNFQRVSRPTRQVVTTPCIMTTLGTQIRRGMSSSGDVESEEELQARFEILLAQRFKSVHIAFEKVLRLVPAASHMLFECMYHHFPHKRLETSFQLSYLNNILQLTNYAPGLQERVLGLIVEKLVAIDVEIKLDDSEEGVFTMDDFLDDACCVDPTQDMVDENADKLDHMMLTVFEYLDTAIQTSEAQNKILFTALLKSFDESIINTHRSKYPQFLLFYICKSSHEHQEVFLSQLISVSLDAKVCS
jgi:RNA polymerase I-specific transcription initiation factor RRN3